MAGLCSWLGAPGSLVGDVGERSGLAGPGALYGHQSRTGRAFVSDAAPLSHRCWHCPALARACTRSQDTHRQRAAGKDSGIMVTVGRLIVGTSGSPGSLQALRYADGLAYTHGAALIPVLAWQPPGGDRDELIPASAELRRTCRELARQQLRDALLAIWGEIPGNPWVQPCIER